MRAGDVPPAMIDAMLGSDEFLVQVREWHKAQLWPTLDGFHIRAAPVGWRDTSRIGGAAPAAALPEPPIQYSWKLAALSTFWPLPHGPSPEPSPHNSATKYYSRATSCSQRLSGPAPIARGSIVSAIASA